MDFSNIKKPLSHGDGTFDIKDFRYFGINSVIEANVLIFHAENISIGDNVYIGHNTILKGYYINEMVIGEGTWIGQNCFLHAAGSIMIGKAVGIGPNVQMITSEHNDLNAELPVLHQPLKFGTITIHDGADIGTGTIILPNITIGEGAIIGAGSVVTHNVEPYSVYAGVPARLIRSRKL